MQLKFLGKNYDITSNTVEGIDTEETLTFLGRRYVVRCYDVPPKQPGNQELRFLGRRYRG